MEKDNYLKHRGKCKQYCEEALLADSSLKIVRGYYYDSFWGKQPHFWIVREDGSIYDPTKLQFPDQNGFYEESNGIFNCGHCGANVKEEVGYIVGNYIYCDYTCYGRDIL